MYLILALSILAGISTKYLDELIETIKGEEAQKWIVSIISSILISYMVFAFPDVMMGIILGAVLMDKTNNRYQILNFLLPLSVFLFVFYEGGVSFPLMFYTLVLSILDESKLNFNGKRPWVPLGLLVLLIFMSIFYQGELIMYYLAASTISLLAFDIGYSVTNIVIKRNQKIPAIS